MKATLLVLFLLCWTACLPPTSTISDSSRGYWNDVGHWTHNLVFSGQGTIARECRSGVAFDLLDHPMGPAILARIQLHLEKFIGTSQESECVQLFPLSELSEFQLTWGITSPEAWEDAASGAPLTAPICFNAGDELAYGWFNKAGLDYLQEAIDGNGLVSFGIPLVTLNGTQDASMQEGLRFGVGDPEPWKHELQIWHGTQGPPGLRYKNPLLRPSASRPVEAPAVVPPAAPIITP